MLRHVAVGNINIDFYFKIPRMPSLGENILCSEAYLGFGGAAANYALATARLSHKVTLIASTSQHPLSNIALKRLEEEGVDISKVKFASNILPGIVVVLVSENGERTMISYRGANTLLDSKMLEDVPSDAKIVYFASVHPDVVINSYKYLEGRDIIISYDPGGEAFKNPKGVLKALNFIDEILVNNLELKALINSESYSDAKTLLKGRVKRVIVKCGGKGVYMVSKDSISYIEAFTHGKVVDTTGAGDVFASAYHTFYLETLDYKCALKAGVIAAGIKVTRKGAQSAPIRSEVEDHLRKWKVNVKSLW